MGVIQEEQNALGLRMAGADLVNQLLQGLGIAIRNAPAIADG